MKQLAQYLIYDSGTVDLDVVQFSLARNPLKGVKRQPDLIIEWSTENKDYYAAYWIKRGQTPMSEKDIKEFCEYGMLLVR